MSANANPARGEAAIELAGRTYVVRPSFAALVAAEEETGSLIALADRAALGAISLAEIEALIWHCLAGRDGMDRTAMAHALVDAGLSAAMPAVRAILRQLLTGSS